MTHYTLREIVAFNLQGEDTYIMNIEWAIPCTVCNCPVLSMPLNDYATKHINC